MWARHQSHIAHFIHPAQCSHSQQTNLPEPLANGLSLLRLSANAAPGSEDLVRDSILREMARLTSAVEEGVSAGGQTLAHHLPCLSSLQAYLLLSMHAYFTSRSGQPGQGVFAPEQIATLHDLASKVSAAGIMCSEEAGGTSAPRWESWVVAEAKHRTVFCVYMFEDVYNYQSGATTYLADELAVLPAPASKWMWQAADRDSFGAEYAEWARAWNEQRALAISKLWPREFEESGDIAAEERRQQKVGERVARWAEGVDEFGMFLLAVCTATHNL